MKVIWTTAAMRDRDEIGSHISLDNPTAAIKLDEMFEWPGYGWGVFHYRGVKG